MITEERVARYIAMLGEDRSPLLERIRASAEAELVPIVRRETESLLRTLIRAVRPSAILEIGTAVGYSALVMAEAMPAGAHITTIENYEKRIPKARENIRLAGEEERITLMEGDASVILPALEGPYDMIFMDAAKGQYIHWLPDLYRLLGEGGLLLSDNVLQGGEAALSRFAVPRRDRTIHVRMREYLKRLTSDPCWETSVLPVGDGVALSVKLPAGTMEER